MRCLLSACERGICVYPQGVLRLFAAWADFTHAIPILGAAGLGARRPGAGNQGSTAPRYVTRRIAHYTSYVTRDQLSTFRGRYVARVRGGHCLGDTSPRLTLSTSHCLVLVRCGAAHSRTRLTSYELSWPRCTLYIPRVTASALETAGTRLALCCPQPLYVLVGIITICPYWQLIHALSSYLGGVDEPLMAG